MPRVRVPAVSSESPRTRLRTSRRRGSSVDATVTARLTKRGLAVATESKSDDLLPSDSSRASQSELDYLVRSLGEDGTFYLPGEHCPQSILLNNTGETSGELLFCVGPLVCAQPPFNPLHLSGFCCARCALRSAQGLEAGDS